MTVPNSAHQAAAQLNLGISSLATYNANPVLYQRKALTGLIANAAAQTTLNGAITAAATTLTLTSATGFPPSANYTILIDSEYMQVTAGQGTTGLTVTRAFTNPNTGAASVAAAHANGATVTCLVSAATTLGAAITSLTATSITVSAATGFPSTGNYIIMIDSEAMLVTAGQSTTTWTVTRGVNHTAAATHLNTQNIYGMCWSHQICSAHVDAIADPTYLLTVIMDGVVYDFTATHLGLS